VTYQDKAEYDFMENILGVKAGTLPNTVFCILGPDGKTRLSRSGRGPFFAYANSATMAAGMKFLAKKYPLASKNVFTDTQLPTVNKVDVALNVAACDNRPLLVSIAADKESLAQVNTKLLPLVWSEQFAGQFVYSSTILRSDLKPLAGANETSAFLIVDPGTYGVSGKVMAQLDATASSDEIKQALVKSLADFTPQVKSHFAHIQGGYDLGIEWESVIAESDAQSVRAKAAFRARQKARP
jgi:hypothetical protein